MIKRKESLVGAVSKAGYQTWYLSKVTVLGLVKLNPGEHFAEKYRGPYTDPAGSG